MLEFLKNALNGREYIFKKDLEKFTGGVLFTHTFDNLLAVPTKNKIENKIACRTDDIAQ